MNFTKKLNFHPNIGKSSPSISLFKQELVGRKKIGRCVNEAPGTDSHGTFSTGYIRSGRNRSQQSLRLAVDSPLTMKLIPACLVVAVCIAYCLGASIPGKNDLNDSLLFSFYSGKHL